MELFYALIVLCLSGSALAQIELPGPCPKINPVQNFDYTKYLGKFYEQFRLTKRDNFTEYCATVENFIDPKKGFWYQVETSSCELTGIRTSTPTVISLVKSKNNIATFNIHMSGRRSDVTTTVLATDYKSYTVVVDCENSDDKTKHLLHVWVFTRELEPSATCLDQIFKALEKVNVKKNLLTKIRQNGCEIKPPPY